MSTINLHDAANALLWKKDSSACCPDLVQNYYPELHQIHVEAEGKTYLVVLGADCRSTDEEGEDYWDDSRWVMSDVCVLDSQAGSMTVIPQSAVTPDDVRGWVRASRGKG